MYRQQSTLTKRAGFFQRCKLIKLREVIYISLCLSRLCPISSICSGHISSRTKANKRHLTTYWTDITNDLNTFINERFLFLILN